MKDNELIQIEDNFDNRCEKIDHEIKELNKLLNDPIHIPTWISYEAPTGVPELTDYTKKHGE